VFLASLSLSAVSLPLSAKPLACGAVAVADSRALTADRCLSLPLLVARIRADDTHDAVAPDDLAVAADLLY
jgi:hypothetical protein